MVFGWGLFYCSMNCLRLQFGVVSCVLVIATSWIDTEGHICLPQLSLSTKYNSCDTLSKSIQPIDWHFISHQRQQNIYSWSGDVVTQRKMLISLASVNVSKLGYQKSFSPVPCFSLCRFEFQCQLTLNVVKEADRFSAFIDVSSADIHWVGGCC